jgi:diguanylate cyclase (GGDEF)-like protein
MKTNDQRPLPRSEDGGGDDNRLGLEVLERMTRPLQSGSVLTSEPEYPPGVGSRPSMRGDSSGGSSIAAHRHEGDAEKAGTDPFTGLANRPLLVDRLEQALVRLRTLGGHVVVFHIELNNLNYVDDQLGSPAANAILQEISHRLLSLLRSEDTVSRVGRSELVAAVSLQAEGTVKLLEGRIEAAFESKIALADREVHMWVTLHSVQAQSGESAEDLLDRLEQMARLEASGTSRAWSLTLNGR